MPRLRAELPPFPVPPVVAAESGTSRGRTNNGRSTSKQQKTKKKNALGKLAPSRVPPASARSSSASASSQDDAGLRARNGTTLIERSTELGQAFLTAFGSIVASMPAGNRGTVGFARHLGIDKVLASRLLKALRSSDPIAVMHHLPGPEPLRRVARAAQDRGVKRAVIDQALSTIDRFESLIREETGDRSALDAILSGLVPESRSGFELRRKQAAYRAMSQLKGVSARMNVGTVLLAPGSDPARIDVVWIFGTLGIQRLRAGVPVKFASRRLGPTVGPRSPRTLRGAPVDAATGLNQLRLEHFCTDPPPPLDVARAGDVFHYTLAEHGFGPRSAVDLVFAEVNRNEIERVASKPKKISDASGHDRPRRTYFFAEVPIPAEALQFDVFVHEAVFPGREPELIVYDTALEGIASPNDPARDIDRLDTREAVTTLGRGIDQARSRDVPFYPALLGEVFTSLAWEPRLFRGWRTRIEYPMYGSQVTLAFIPA